jgi:hypothetical protein
MRNLTGRRRKIKPKNNLKKKRMNEKCRDREERERELICK